MNSLVLYNNGLEDNQQIIQWLYDEMFHYRDISVGLLDHKMKYAVNVMTGFKDFVKANEMEEMFKHRNPSGISLMNSNVLRISSSASSVSSFRGYSINRLVFNNFNLMKKKDIEKIFCCFIPVMELMRKTTENGICIEY